MSNNGNGMETIWMKSKTAPTIKIFTLVERQSFETPNDDLTSTLCKVIYCHELAKI